MTVLISLLIYITKLASCHTHRGQHTVFSTYNMRSEWGRDGHVTSAVGASHIQRTPPSSTRVLVDSLVKICLTVFTLPVFLLDFPLSSSLLTSLSSPLPPFSPSFSLCVSPEARDQCQKSCSIILHLFSPLLFFLSFPLSPFLALSLFLACVGVWSPAIKVRGLSHSPFSVLLLQGLSLNPELVEYGGPAGWQASGWACAGAACLVTDICALPL